MSISIKHRVQLVLTKSVNALLAQQQDNGSVKGYCRSRILESSLTLHLLRNLSYFPSKQKQIENYLTKAIADNALSNYSTTIEKVIAIMAQQKIKPSFTSNQSFSQLLHSLSEREQGRKIIYFGCLFAEMGMVSFSNLPFDISAFKNPELQLQTWAKVMLCSLKVLYCFGIDQEHLLTLEEKNFLVSKVLQTDIFENNVLTQIVGLLALSKLHSRSQLNQPMNALMQWLQADGGMPLMTGIEHFVTPLAGIAILEALPNLSVQQQLEAKLAVIRMADYLALVQAEDGGWSYMLGTTQTDLDDSALCGVLLAKVDKQKFKTNLEKFGQYIAQMQNEDGGFPTYIKGNPSTPSMTAAALHGMAEIWRCHSMKSLLTKESIYRALCYLLATQKDNGTFERRWSNANTHAMFRVAIALRSVQDIDISPDIQQKIDILLQRMIDYLRTEQNLDGGWGQTPKDLSDVLSTAYALLCFSNSEKELAAKGITFLLSGQKSDGTFESRPDLLGPRPLPYNIPILSTIITTHACSYFIKNLA